MGHSYTMKRRFSKMGLTICSSAFLFFAMAAGAACHSSLRIGRSNSVDGSANPKLDTNPAEGPANTPGAGGISGTGGAGSGGLVGTGGIAIGGLGGAGTGGTEASCTSSCTLVAPKCLSGTSLQACAVLANGCSSDATSACVTGQVCERYGTAACADPNWVAWPVPNSQPDVTAGAPNPESYTDNGDGTVTDNVTALMWQQASPVATYTWDEAMAYCPTLALGGHDDWRLPSFIELYSLVDTEGSPPVPNVGYFRSPSENGPLTFWSSTPVVQSTPAAFCVDFQDGHTNGYVVANTLNVRCVR